MSDTIKLGLTTLTFNKIWYVDGTNGNDSTGDGSTALPYATTTPLSAAGAISTDAVVYAAGTYTFSNNCGARTFIGASNGTTRLLATSIPPNSGSITIYDCLLTPTATTATNDMTFATGGGGATSTFNNCVFRYYQRTISDYSSYSRNVFIEITDGHLNFNNCSFINCYTGIMSSASYSKTINFKNCSFNGTIAPQAFLGDTNPAATITNTASLYNIADTAYDANYKITVAGWLNLGDTATLDPDGSRSSIGVYGGPYAWGVWYTLQYLIKDLDRLKVLSDGIWNDVGAYPTDMTETIFSNSLVNVPTTLPTSTTTLNGNAVTNINCCDAAGNYVVFGGNSTNISVVDIRTNTVTNWPVSANVNDVVTDGTYVYVALMGSPANLVRVAIADGSTTTIATGLSQPHHLTLSDGYLYVAQDSSSVNVLRRYRLSDLAPDGAPVTGTSINGTLAVGNYVYACSSVNAALYMVDKTTLAVTTITVPAAAITSNAPLATDGTYVYFAGATKACRVSIGGTTVTSVTVPANFYGVVADSNGSYYFGSATPYCINVNFDAGTYSTTNASIAGQIYNMALTNKYAILANVVYGTMIFLDRSSGALTTVTAVTNLGHVVVSPSRDVVYGASTTSSIVYVQVSSQGAFKPSQLTDSALRQLITPELLMWTDDPASAKTMHTVASPNVQVIKETSDHVYQCTAFSFASTGPIGVLFSGDSGTTWYGLSGAVLATVDTGNSSDVIAKMITTANLSTVTPAMINSVAPDKIRFAVVINQSLPTTTTNIDSLSASYQPQIQTKLVLNSVDKTALNALHVQGAEQQSLTYADLVDGNNTIVVYAITENGDDESSGTIVKREASHRLTVDRDFTAIDGGYTHDGITFNGTASGTGTLLTTNDTCIDLHGYSGITAINAVGVGGRYALSFDGRSTWNSKVVTGYTDVLSTTSSVPVLTSDTSSPFVSVSASSLYGGSYAYLAFDDTDNGWDSSSAYTSAWLKVTFTYGRVIKGYSIRANGGSPSANVAKTWTFEGSNDGSNWTILDTRTNETGWTGYETRSYTMVNNTAYTMYRINVTAWTSGSYVMINKLNLFEGTPTYEWQTIQLSDLPTKGTLVDALNAVTSSELAPMFQRTQLDFATYLMAGESVDSLTVTLPDYQAPIISGDSITPDHAHNQDVTLVATLTDVDGDDISYSVSINGTQYLAPTAPVQGPVSVNVVIPKANLIVGTNTIRLNVSCVNKAGYRDYTVEVVESPPVATVTQHDYRRFIATIGDADNDTISYKLVLQNITDSTSVDLIPQTDYLASPTSIDVAPGTLEYKKQYKYILTYQDSLGASGSVEYTFDGNINGVAFYDVASDSYWSDGTGKVLATLDFGLFEVGSSSAIKSVSLINNTGLTLSGIQINATDVYPDTTVMFSLYSDMSQAASTLDLGAYTMNDADSKVFYVQVSANENAKSAGKVTIIGTGVTA